MMQIPTIEWPFPEGNRVQVLSKAVPDYARRMAIIAALARTQYSRI